MNADRELEGLFAQHVLEIREDPPGPPVGPDEDHDPSCVFDGRHGLDGGDCDCGIWDRLLYWDGNGWGDLGVPRVLASGDGLQRAIDTRSEWERVTLRRVHRGWTVEVKSTTGRDFIANELYEAPALSGYACRKAQVRAMLLAVGQRSELVRAGIKS